MRHFNAEGALDFILVGDRTERSPGGQRGLILVGGDRGNFRPIAFHAGNFFHDANDFPGKFVARRLPRRGEVINTRVIVDEMPFAQKIGGRFR